MGLSFKAHCMQCGYTSDILDFGRGMLNFSTVDREPVINLDTNEIETANGMERENIEKEHPNIKFLYHHRNLSKDYPDPSIGSGGDTGVKKNRNREFYLCPKCGEFKIEFQYSGVWD